MFTNYSESDLEAGRKAFGGGGVGDEIPFVVDYGKGALLFDKAGQEYIDCTSQAWSLNIGYSHPKVIQAVEEVLGKYSHIRTSFETVPKLLLSKKLVELAPAGLDRVIYTITGSEANEGALKIAMHNHPGNTFVSMFDGYHGRTLATLNLSWPHPGNRFTAWSAPIVRIPQAYCYRCPLKLTHPECSLACVDLAKTIIEKGASEPPVALIMEPIQGNGGMIDFPRDYYPAIRKMCDDLGMLLIYDEIQTGFGRLGTWFGADLYETTPDIMVIGKALGGGLPLFGVLFNSQLQGLAPGDHSFTFAHFPLSMAAANATIQVLEEEHLLDRANRIGAIFTDRLRELQNQYELIGDIRGPGLMIGVELVKDRITKEPAREETNRFVKEGLKRGVIFGESKYLGLGNIVKIKPPLVITEIQVARTLDVFEEILREIS
ncbi:MAG TPA: aspartate aminotransferase family protein [Anaerolineales bacterium]|nr:aspartate aminotransferase family protein [Anaerolineales bacterium]